MVGEVESHVQAERQGAVLGTSDSRATIACLDEGNAEAVESQYARASQTAADAGERLAAR